MVASVADGSVREIVAQQAPCVLLLDPDSIGVPGQEVVEDLSHHCRIVVVRMEPRPEEIYRLLTAGAVGFLGKDCSAQEVRDAISAAARGEARIGASIQPLLADELRLRRAGTREFLTDRELEILKLMADGLTAPEIAAKLEIGTATVKTHQSNMYARFGVHDAKAAIVHAMRLKLIE